MRRTASLTAHSFVAQCFGPDKAKGEDVLVELVPGSLVICLADGVRQAVPLTTVKLSKGGFNQTQWHFTWKQDGANWSVVLSDTAAQQKLIAKPPIGLENQLAELQTSQRKGRWLSRLGWTIVTLVVLLPIALLGIFWWQADKIANWGIERISTEQEATLGASIFEAQKPGLKLVEQPQLQAALESIGSQLTAGSTYQYRWFINQDPTINAFAVPGGIVVVNTGLIKASDSPEELAGVLAHEVQHVEQRHSLKGMVKGLGLQALMEFALGDYSGTLTAQMAKDLGELRFSRDQEREADEKGFDLLLKNHIQPKGMVSMFEKLQKETRANTVNLFSSHPDTAERVASLKQRLAALSINPKDYPALNTDWAKLKTSLPK
ncbi:M48 family metallopeptidase [Leeia oryzae]|uniref:M48 family metallopeptidase n=1 Tax=Leeia oryzae TaxID=356662 RepID=UPI00037C2550|nr:M48 family metallopeptidase [Leeia oryzae]